MNKIIVRNISLELHVYVIIHVGPEQKPTLLMLEHFTDTAYECMLNYSGITRDTILDLEADIIEHTNIFGYYPEKDFIIGHIRSGYDFKISAIKRVGWKSIKFWLERIDIQPVHGSYIDPKFEAIQIQEELKRFPDPIFPHNPYR